MDVNMPIEYIICGLADLLREGEVDIIPVETLVALKDVVEKEIIMSRTVH